MEGNKLNIDEQMMTERLTVENSLHGATRRKVKCAENLKKTT